MNVIKFEWDENKNEINKKKHKISFEEAKTVFYDENALLIDDPEHSSEEDRFIIMGLSTKANLLVVCHCYRENPYAKKLKKQITINIDNETIDYFKAQSESSGIPYQTLINLYLADCAANKKKLHMSWV